MLENNKPFLEELNFRDQLDNYLRYWKWFALSIFVFLILAFLKLNFTRSEYSATSSVLVKSDGGGEDSKLSVFQDLGIFGKSRDGIVDEIEILKSKSLVFDAVKSLGLNIQYFTDKNDISSFFDNTFSMSTNFFENERYVDPPLKINFFAGDSIIENSYAHFIITVISPTEYRYTDEFKSKKSAFGERIPTKMLGDIIITPNFGSNNEIIGNDILINVTPVKSIANSYVKTIEILPKSEFSNILEISFTSNVREKAEDFLNELISKYNNRSVAQKELLTKITSDFVNTRLGIIESELSDIDLTAETFKTQNRLTDVASAAGLNLQSGQAIESQIVEANTQLQQIGYVKEYVSSQEADELIPVNVGINDNGVSTLSQQYNQLMMEKQRLLENSTEKNPIIVNINEQLKTLKNNIGQGLNNLESSQKISIDALNRQDARINSRLYSAPKKERLYRTIQRQQQIKEALFLYLLQKREETAITLGVAEPNAKIIDKPESYPFPIAPKKSVYYLTFFLIGLLIPFVTIYAKDYLDTKIKSREEVQKILNIPILGDIPKLETKKFLISHNDHSSMAEAFRILRTNLSFMLTHAKSKGKTIFITSTIAHEGKSLVASNLAASLALAGKKTLLIGMDIRAPKIKEYLGIRGKTGVTNYIIDERLTISDIIIDTKIDNLDLISSGDIAPNPAELLMNSRVIDLFDMVKENYDYIIVDTPASSRVTDTMLLRDYADAFVYVIRANFLDKRHLGYVHSLYKDNVLPNLALLINGVDHKRGYGYGYGYGTNFETTKSKWWKFKI